MNATSGRPKKFEKSQNKTARYFSTMCGMAGILERYERADKEI
jgi:geranylgeranyl pyrophosphate synthase